MRDYLLARLMIVGFRLVRFGWEHMRPASRAAFRARVRARARGETGINALDVRRSRQGGDE